MTDTDDILDYDLNLNTDSVDIELINANKFVLLSITSFGLYDFWWMYKSWKFFKEKDNLDINPIGRAIFGILFAYALYERIQNYAHSNGYEKSYSSSALFVGLIIFNLLSRLPDPFWIVSFFSFICVLQPLQAFNFAISKSKFYNGIDRSNFNTRQIILIVIGGILLFLMLYALFLESEEVIF